MNQLRSYLRTGTASKLVSIILSIALLVTMLPIAATADEDAVVGAADIAIGTAAPVNGKLIDDGTVTVTGGKAVVTWSSDDGASYVAASGKFAQSTVYRTKYVLTADTGYVFDPVPGVYEKKGVRDLSASIANLSQEPFSATFTATVSRGFALNDTLTIIVTWPNATIEPSDIFIGTIAPVVGAAIDGGTNTFNKGTIGIRWESTPIHDPMGSTYAGNTFYSTFYVFTAREGYAFDTTDRIYVDGAKSLKSRIDNAGAAYSIDGMSVKTTTHANDTLTIRVTKLAGATFESGMTYTSWYSISPSRVMQDVSGRSDSVLAPKPMFHGRKLIIVQRLLQKSELI